MVSSPGSSGYISSDEIAIIIFILLGLLMAGLMVYLAYLYGKRQTQDLLRRERKRSALHHNKAKTVGPRSETKPVERLDDIGELRRVAEENLRYLQAIHSMLSSQQQSSGVSAGSAEAPAHDRDN